MGIPETRKAFAEGGLPDQARARIEALRNDPRRFFTTTFTVAEMAIARLAGYEPIAQVMGSSIYHVGWSSLVGFGGGELDAVTHAKRHARWLALSRLEEEATLLGASAVIGVVLEIHDYPWSGELSEFTAVGTAVRTSGAIPERPALTNLTVQQLYKLELAGLWPVGIAMGNCTFYGRHADCRSDGSWFNQELPEHTRIIDQARSLATARFKGEVSQMNALGAVNVEVKRHFDERHWEANKTEHTSFKAEVVLLGTAILRRKEATLPRPRLVLDLCGGLGDRKVDLNLPATGDSSPSAKKEA